MMLQDKVMCWLAYKLPKRLAYWCFIRVGSFASVKLDDIDVSELSVLDALRAWKFKCDNYKRPA